MRGGSHFPKAKETGRSCHQPSGSFTEAFTPFLTQWLPRPAFSGCSWAAITPTHMSDPRPMSPWHTGLISPLIPGQGTGEGRGEAWAFPSLFLTSSHPKGASCTS